jgi:MFS transporter, SP family, sugar:H+ symporter
VYVLCLLIPYYLGRVYTDPLIDIYLGMQLAVIPTFLAEIAPAHLRGGTGALYWLSIKVDSHNPSCCIAANFSVWWTARHGHRSGYLERHGQYRLATSDRTNPDLPCCRGMSGVVYPRGMCLPILYLDTLVEDVLMAQSPRWLLLAGRRDQALTALTRLRQTREEKRNNAPASDELLAEFSDLSLAVEDIQRARREREISRIRQFFSIFDRSNIRRTLIVVFLLFFQQSTGQSFASQYGTLFVEALHSVNAFSVTLGTNAIDIGGILCCILLADRLGRRPVLIISAFLQTAALLTMGALGAASSSPTSAPTSIKDGIVAMLLLFSFGWSFGYAPLAYVVAAELPSPYLREYTLNVGYTVKLAMEFVVSFTYPYLEDADKANLGGKLGFIYGSVAFLAFLFSVFFVPETKNIELEDMDEVFGGIDRTVETKEQAMAAEEAIPSR